MPGRTTCIAIEEFDGLDLPEDRRWELHDGEVVEVTFPVFAHRRLQDRIVSLAGTPIYRCRRYDGMSVSDSPEK